jgi:choline dehydrogenase-like flavoprotein
MPGVDTPVDGASGDNGVFWHPTSVDPTRFWRSYARTGHYDGITRSNFQVITRQKVRRVLFEGTTATGVEFAARDGSTTPRTVRARREVILSAGTIHSPQILQLSGIGPAPLLQQAGIPLLVDLPGVGQHFQDHMYLSVGFRCTSRFRGTA